MKQLIQKLTETFSPSGYEDAVRALILAEIEPLADEVRVDALGNLIARKGIKAENGKRVMVAAHMDEIGLIATHVDANGFARFITIGLSNTRYLLGGHVRFTSGARGVIASEKPDKNNEVPPVERLFIDVGATSREACPVKVGEVAAFERPFVDLGARLVAKSLDNRAGVAVAIETLRRLGSSPELVEGPGLSAPARSGQGPNEVYFVFTAQEEVGVRGATVSAFGIDPQVGLAVDATSAGDTPNAVRREVALGKGPAIKIKDSQMLADPKVVAWMERVARESGIPTQREVFTSGSTDARAIQLTRSGVPTGVLSIPCRYVHSPSEMVDYGDVENAVTLLAGMLSAPIELA